MDFREEFQSSESREATVSEVILIDNKVDLAFLRLERSAVTSSASCRCTSRRNRTPSSLRSVVTPPEITAIRPWDMARIFRDIYNVKRLAPGRVMDARASSTTFTHKHDAGW